MRSPNQHSQSNERNSKELAQQRVENVGVASPTLNVVSNL